MDSQDRERVDEAKQELHRILSDREMKDCLLLVFANKQDLPGGMSSSRLTTSPVISPMFAFSASSPLSSPHGSSIPFDCGGLPPPPHALI